MPDVLPYTGKQKQLEVNKGLGASGAIAENLIKPYIGKQHIVYIDNWFSSPSLYQYLFNKNTGAVGTVKKNRKHYPKFPATTKNQPL